MRLEIFDGHQYLNLETFRKDGRGVKTPVWFVREGDALYVWTQADSGKVKRIRRSGRVRIAPSDARGNPLGEWLEARAQIQATPEAIRHVQGLMAAKYGLLFYGFRLLGKLRRVRYVTLRLTLPGEDAQPSP